MLSGLISSHNWLQSAKVKAFIQHKREIWKKESGEVLLVKGKETIFLRFAHLPPSFYLQIYNLGFEVCKFST
jgi:hypothetical protein